MTKASTSQADVEDIGEDSSAQSLNLRPARLYVSWVEDALHAGWGQT